MVRVGQRIETLGKDILVADFLRAQRREHLPRHAFRQLDSNAFLQRFIAFHHDAVRRPIAQVVAFAEQIGVAPLDIRLCSLHARYDGRKCLRDVHLHVACLILILGMSNIKCHAQADNGG